MAVTPSRATVTTSAVLLASNAATDPGEGDYRNRRFIIKNSTGTASVFLGGSGVTTATGLEWAPDDGPLGDIELEPGESLYGIVAATTQTVHVLRTGR